MNITFEKLREIKHSLPSGSIRRIAHELNMDEQTVRNYFGGTDYQKGGVPGIHIQPGPGGGIVNIEDTKVLDLAERIITESHSHRMN